MVKLVLRGFVIAFGVWLFMFYIALFIAVVVRAWTGNYYF